LCFQVKQTHLARVLGVATFQGCIDAHFLLRPLAKARPETTRLARRFGETDGRFCLRGVLRGAPGALILITPGASFLGAKKILN
jgi:hypothetical protein